MNIFDLSRKHFGNLQLFHRQKSNSGLTQVEMLVTLILLGILLTIALSVYHRLMAWNSSTSSGIGLDCKRPLILGMIQKAHCFLPFMLL